MVMVATVTTEVGPTLLALESGEYREKEREMVGDRNVLVDSGSVEIKWIITRPKVQENSGTVGNSLGGNP